MRDDPELRLNGRLRQQIALSGFSITVKDEELCGPHWDNRICLPLLIREFNQKRPVAIPFEMLDYGPDLPAR
jgi:hypothetical protein